MKFKIYDLGGLYSLITLLGLVATFGLVPSAFAMPGLGTSEAPDPVFEGAAITIEATSTAFNAPHEKVSFRVYEPPLNPAFPSDNPQAGVPPANCLGLFPVTGIGAVGPTVWQLHRDDGSPGTLAQFKISDPGNVRVTFGNPLTPLEVVTMTNAIITDAGTGGHKWVRQDGTTKADNSGTPASIGNPPYRWAACGFESITANTFQEFVSDSVFNNKKPVGGIILPIDTTALVLGGILSNSIWILPVFAAIAGGAFVLLKFQVNRKQY